MRTFRCYGRSLSVLIEPLLARPWRISEFSSVQRRGLLPEEEGDEWGALSRPHRTLSLCLASSSLFCRSYGALLLPRPRCSPIGGFAIVLRSRSRPSLGSRADADGYCAQPPRARPLVAEISSPRMGPWYTSSLHRRLFPASS